MNNAVFRKTMENMRKQRYQTCKNPSKEKLFSVATKLSCNKNIFNHFISSRNEKNINNQE